jgi:hypothetical protein
MHEATPSAAWAAAEPIIVPDTHIVQLLGRPPHAVVFWWTHCMIATQPSADWQVAIWPAQSVHLLGMQVHRSKLASPPDIPASDGALDDTLLEVVDCTDVDVVDALDVVPLGVLVALGVDVALRGVLPVDVTWE